MRKIAYIAVWTFVATIPLDRMFLDQVLGTGVHVTVTQVVGILALLVAIVATLFEARLRRFDRSHLFIFIFLFWACLSCLWSLDPESALSRALTYLQLALMVWMLTQFAQTREEQTGIMLAYVLGSLFVASQLIIGYIVGGTVFSVELFPGRFTSMGYNPNDLALMLALGVPLAWFCFTASSGFTALAGLAYMPAAAAAILLSASRGGSIATIVAAMILPLGFSMLTWFRRLIIAVAIVAAGLAASVMVPERSWERLMTIDDEASTTWSISNLQDLDLMNMRVAIWREGLEVFKERPVVGVGAGGYINVVEPVHGERRVAHNVFLSVLVELGVVGLVLFLTMLIYLAYSTRFLVWDERLLWLVMLATFTVGGLFLTWEHTKQTWLIMGLVAARVSMVRVRQPREMVPDQTMAVLRRHMERQKWERVRQQVVSILVDEKAFEDDDRPFLLFERLAEVSDDFESVEEVVGYFRSQFDGVLPESIGEWRGVARSWAEQLRRLVISDF